MSDPTPGQAICDSLRETAEAAFGRPTSEFARWDDLPDWQRERFEAAGRRVLAIAAQQPQRAPGDVDAAFASGARVRTGPCTAATHDREHFQVRTNGHWLCGHLLASLLIAHGIVTGPGPQPAPELAAITAERDRFRALLDAHLPLWEYYGTSTTPQPAPEYPRPDGDMTVIGPECFASGDETVIAWKGENYYRPDARSGDSPTWEQLADSLRRDRDSLFAETEKLRRQLRDAALSELVLPQPAPEAAPLFDSKQERRPSTETGLITEEEDE